MKIAIRNLTKTYESQTVLDDISLDIVGMGTIGIIGESGCGKSTLLRQLSGIEDADSGTIVINGVSPIKEKEKFQKGIGYVFQKHNLFPHLSLKENIALILRKSKNMDKKSAELKALALLKKLHIENERDKKPSQVSGGQAQRCSIARALATEPELIFLDEPTAALDPILTSEVLKAVTELKKEGIKFIFVTHEIAFLREFADYFVFLKNGKICEHGEVSFLQNPRTEDLREFLHI